MRKFAALAWLLGLAAVVLQAFALATQYFQRWFDGDYLYPQWFAADLLSGRYPMSGWTLSSAPYFFPDFAGCIALLSFTHGAPVLPYYVAITYLLLALIAGWSLWQAGWKGWSGWIAGTALINGLLVWRGVDDHARYLWWLGTAGMHGGAVLLGLTQFALWAGPVEEDPAPLRKWTAGVLLFLGLISDTLFLTQFIIPLAVALLVSAGSKKWQAPRVRSFFVAMGWASVGLLAWRIGLAATGWLRLSKVMRYAPTPSAILSATGRLTHDFEAVLWRNGWGFVALALAGFVVATALVWRSRRDGEPQGVEQRQACWFAVLCLLSTVALPLMTAYWKDAQNARYLLPVIVVPLWWALRESLNEAKARWRSHTARWIVLFTITGGSVAMGVKAWREIRPEAWQWPYPHDVAQIDAFLAGEKRVHGLADYWTTYYFNAVSRAHLRLNQLSPDGHVKFWSNNAFWYFDVDESSRQLKPVRYDFIITDGLDESALEKRYGPPARRIELADYTIWLYDQPGARRISSQVENEVRTFLRGRPGADRISPAAE